MKRKIAIFAAIVLSLQMVMSAVVPVAATGNESKAPVKANVPSIVHEDVEGDLLKGAGSFDKKNILMSFASTPQNVSKTWVEDENGGYIESGVFPNEYTGMHYSPGINIPAGKYKLTFWVRTVYEGHKTMMSPMIVGTDSKIVNFNDSDQPAKWFFVGVTDEWTKVEFCFELKAPLSYIKFRPSTNPDALVPFCVDEVSLVEIKSIPGNMSYNQGADVSAADIKASAATLDYISEYTEDQMWDPNEDYEIDGLMLNLDNTAHGIGAITDEQYVYDWVAQFDGTHVTDLVVNIAESKCVYPTEVFFGWYGDGKTTYANGKITTETGVSNAYTKHFNDLKLDYLQTLSEALPAAGINMWMSIRMNDAHDRTLAESSLFTEYFFEHPEFRRIQYDSKVDTYYAKIWDYSFPEIREKYLALLNESLDRYDVYGFQFEWQREMRLFHQGGEYAGIEIMNQFHRDADAIISVYEEKYGHEIKFSVTVAPDLQTNYDFGLDVMTWVSEGILDMVVPMGRWATTYNELPVALWKSLLDPYGVELAPCIEHGIVIQPAMTAHMMPTIEHYTGTSALYLSQGADKIQLYNILVNFSHIFKDKDKIAVYDSELSIPETPGSKLSEPGWWVLLTSCGSYEKLMTLNRKVIPTYNDVASTWKSVGATAQLPVSVRVGSAVPVRVGIGDVPKGAKVTLSIAASSVKEDNVPEVYVNSEPCEFIEIAESPDINRTQNKVWKFEVPESAYDDMFAVVEIAATKRPGFVTDYVEIYIEPAK